MTQSHLSVFLSVHPSICFVLTDQLFISTTCLVCLSVWLSMFATLTFSIIFSIIQDLIQFSPYLYPFLLTSSFSLHAFKWSCDLETDLYIKHQTWTTIESHTNTVNYRYVSFADLSILSIVWAQNLTWIASFWYIYLWHRKIEIHQFLSKPILKMSKINFCKTHISWIVPIFGLFWLIHMWCVL